MIKLATFTEEQNEKGLNFDEAGDVLPSGFYAYDVKGGIPEVGPIGPFPSKRKARSAAYRLWYRGQK